MKVSPLLTGVSLSHGLRGKHEGPVLGSVLVGPVHFVLSEPRADGAVRSDFVLVFVVSSQHKKDGQSVCLRSDLTVPGQCSRVTLCYIRQRQHTLLHTHTHTHTHMGEGAMWTSGSDHSERREGRVGFLFFLKILLRDTLFLLLLCWELAVCQNVDSSNSQRTDGHTARLESCSRALSFFEAPHSCLLFVSLYLGAPEVRDGAVSGCIHRQSCCCQLDGFHSSDMKWRREQERSGLLSDLLS